MTNKELVAIFEHAEKGNENIFDIYDELSLYAEEYNEMDIANIKYTIYDAYELYCAHKDNTTKILDAIFNGDYTKIVEAFDLKKLFEQIPAEYMGMFEQLIEQFQEEE